MMSRAEHLQWAKDRALEYANRGDFSNAYASFLSDLGKHSGLMDARELCASLGGRLLAGGHLNSIREMTNWVEGFN